ncbi:unnamed protein product [Coffea canephora]|uniref:Fe2OG dioxygenase domain-containing protein n=1 Tax=Coffea canephora TaxID=49390 RepID=A0A068USF8_COFCA|nr:unnamed protein product [Coffea canephora]
MSASFLDEVLEVTGKFFKLPLDEKRTYSRDENGIDGYGNDVIYSDRQTLDWNDRLYLHVLPKSITKLKNGLALLKNLPHLPPPPTKTMHSANFDIRLRVMNEIIVKAMEKSLDLEENRFLDQFGESPIVLARFNFYPPCPWPDRILAAKPQGVASGATYLLQDKEVEGLQVLKDDQWWLVPLTPNAIAFNVGDQVEIMTNGIYKSPIHRVATNRTRERERDSGFVLCS